MKIMRFVLLFNSGGGLMEMIKTAFGHVKNALYFLLSCLSPSNIREKYYILRSMTLKEIGVAFLKLNFTVAFGALTFLIKVVG